MVSRRRNSSGGVSYGQSDPWSYKAVENPTYCYDLHATVLHLLGIDHQRLTYRHDGIDRRLTDVHGRVIREVLACIVFGHRRTLLARNVDGYDVLIPVGGASRDASGGLRAPTASGNRVFEDAMTSPNGGKPRFAAALSTLPDTRAAVRDVCSLRYPCVGARAASGDRICIDPPSARLRRDGGDSAFRGECRLLDRLHGRIDRMRQSRSRGESAIALLGSPRARCRAVADAPGFRNHRRRDCPYGMARTA